MTLILAIMPTELTEGRRKYGGLWVCRESSRVLFTDNPAHHPPPSYHIQMIEERERERDWLPTFFSR